MAENRLHVHAGNNQKTPAGTLFPESCVAQVSDSSGTEVEGVEVRFTLRGSAAPVFLSPPSSDGIRWHAVTSSAGLAAAIPITPYFAGAVEVHVTVEMVPGPDPVDSHLVAT
ncbi:hypothetical protein [Nocardia sp. CA-119907]|uniref:hypothetical protein n=1 Tax=Nocardia sp. CA-119907 TaxID=3239973 RepID=UPI003D98547C